MTKYTLLPMIPMNMSHSYNFFYKLVIDKEVDVGNFSKGGSVGEGISNILFYPKKK